MKKVFDMMLLFVLLLTSCGSKGCKKGCKGKDNNITQNEDDGKKNNDDNKKDDNKTPDDDKKDDNGNNDGEIVLPPFYF